MSFYCPEQTSIHIQTGPRRSVPRLALSVLLALLPVQASANNDTKGDSSKPGEFETEKPEISGSASTTPPPDYETAKRHYSRAEEAKKAKNWSTAATEFTLAYEITKDPLILLQLGKTYEANGQCKEAVEYYEQYNAEAKRSGKYPLETYTRVSDCIVNTAKDPSLPGPRISTVPETDTTPIGAPTTQDTEDLEAYLGVVEDDEPVDLHPGISRTKTIALISVGLSSALLTSSAVLALSAQGREDNIDDLLQARDSDGRPNRFDQETSDRYQTLRDDGNTLNTWSIVALGLAGASAATAVILFVVDARSSERVNTLGAFAPTISNNSVGVSTHWEF